MSWRSRYVFPGENLQLFVRRAITTVDKKGKCVAISRHREGAGLGV